MDFTYAILFRAWLIDRFRIGPFRLRREFLLEIVIVREECIVRQFTRQEHVIVDGLSVFQGFGLVSARHRQQCFQRQFRLPQRFECLE